MRDCLFCKFANGLAFCNKIYEDKDTLAFLDIAGDVYGHTLVIPKGHCKNLLDAEPRTIQAVMATVQKIARHYTENCDVEGVNIFINNNEAAEQQISHLHVHIVPRTRGDMNSIYADLPRNNFDFDHMLERFRLPKK